MTISDVCVQGWLEAPSLQDDGRVLYHWLAATSLPLSSDGDAASPDGDAAGTGDDGTEGAAGETISDSSLALLIPLLRAERGFVLQVQGVAADKVELGAVLASRDFDGEPVSQPERKVPTARLREAASSGQPIVVNAGSSEALQPGVTVESAAAQGVALPLLASGSVVAVAYLENRFQPLDLNRENVRIARAHATLWGMRLEIEKLEAENRSLWLDLTRLREEQAAVKPLELAAPARSRAAARSAKRQDLKGEYSSIVGDSSRILEILQVLDRISGSCAPVLINGESGTGKELVAQAIHQNSPRKGKVFVSENCGALTETLLESELFGYVKGAFTGAAKDHKGLFELAEGGTLFLDEVGDMSAGMQKKLLRVLQEGVIRRVGGKDFIPVNVRVISATNKDLLEEVHAGNFREDLYYRLNVINLKLPPLRERREDIPLLVERFLTDLGREAGVARSIEPAALDQLTNYSWPGNIRELRNEISKLLALVDGDIRIQDLSETIRLGDRRDFPFQSLEKELPHLTLREATERLEKEMIRQAIAHCRGNKSLMAKLLQVPKTSLYNKISKYGLERG
jgi:DNA-binding NtrC family response regulator